MANQVGPAKAARKLGIPVGTLTCWSYHARKAAAQLGDTEGQQAVAEGQTTPELITDKGSEDTRGEPVKATRTARRWQAGD